jgi:transposase
MEAERLVFLDEKWASTNITCRYGRCARGASLVDPIHHGHWEKTTFVVALRVDELKAPTVIDGAMNGELVEASVQQQLAPTLRFGDVVILDNLSSHKRAVVRRPIESVGATLRHLPPYSPDLNPIELSFAKLKSLLRKGQERTVAAFWIFLGKALDSFSPGERRNCYGQSLRIQCYNFVKHSRVVSLVDCIDQAADHPCDDFRARFQRD